MLVITNPTHSNVTVTLLPYCEQPEDKNLPQLCGRLTLPNDSFDIPAKETITDLDSGMVFTNLRDFEVKTEVRIRVKLIQSEIEVKFSHRVQFSYGMKLRVKKSDFV